MTTDFDVLRIRPGRGLEKGFVAGRRTMADRVVARRLAGNSHEKRATRKQLA